jgi:hypothetical protein
MNPCTRGAVLQLSPALVGRDEELQDWAISGLP